MAETTFNKNQIIAELVKSPHGKLEEYVSMGTSATRIHPDFMAHLIAWNKRAGQIRDSKVALPVVSITVKEFDPEFVENSIAHLVMLPLRDLLRAYMFARAQKLRYSPLNKLRNAIAGRIREFEADVHLWDRVAVQHRKALKELYSRLHLKPSDRAKSILFERKYPAGSIFESVAQLYNMQPAEAAGVILKRKIPFMVAKAALREKIKDQDLLFALIDRMTPTELVTNTKNLERWGMKTNAALRGAYEKALGKASTSTKNILKTTRAAGAVKDEGLKEKLTGLQERQIKAHKGIEGNWLVLGDKSPSMQLCIDGARHVAGTLAKFVKGKIYLVFFDEGAQYFDVTGMDYEKILALTKQVKIGSGTSIGCGVDYAITHRFEVDGIAVVSDAQENSVPWFYERYGKLCQQLDKEIPVYLFRFQPGTHGWADRDLAITMANNGHKVEEFDLRGKNFDFYSLPNLVAGMRTNRYSLIDEIMATPLLKLSDVVKSERKEEEDDVVAVTS